MVSANAKQERKMTTKRKEEEEEEEDLDSTTTPYYPTTPPLQPLLVLVLVRAPEQERAPETGPALELNWNRNSIKPSGLSTTKRVCSAGSFSSNRGVLFTTGFAKDLCFIERSLRFAKLRNDAHHVCSVLSLIHKSSKR